MHRRELPWRAGEGERADPYRVWLSEVMLQQTRVETVRGYYDRWLERFPTLQQLAEAPLDEVMKAWEGLGYYSRARNFHAAVREVSARYGGRVPDDEASFRALPGVGRYTAGAVLSIAFGQPEPVVDGNVRRVLARLTDDPAPDPAELWRLAALLARGEAPGELNQALMEMGATLCTPRAPDCARCPLAAECRARAAGTQLLRPAPRKAKPLPHEDTAVAVVQRAGELLLVRRRVEDRLGGLWAFPWALREKGEARPRAAERAVRQGLGMEVRAGAEIGAVPHVFTHVRATYHAFLCSWSGGEPSPLGYDDWRWLPPERVAELALPVAQQRIAALAAAQLAARLAPDARSR
jgi:A/G-specific adenine glycosylase